jgi:hypothetical protein
LTPIDEETFDFYVNSFEQQKRKFIIEEKRTFKKLLMRGKTIFLCKGKANPKKKEMTRDEKTKFFTLSGMVVKSVNSFLIKNNFEVEKIEGRYGSSWVNRKKYQALKEGAKFYYIDMSHCFWRIAYMKGYITERLYLSILSQPEMKQFRNMSLACIVAPVSRKYFDNGKKINEIYEDKRLHTIIYNNIRFTAYNLIGDIQRYLPESVISYKTDAVIVQKSGLAKVKKIFKDSGFDYTITECFKQDEIYYFYDEKLKKM